MVHVLSVMFHKWKGIEMYAEAEKKGGRERGEIVKGGRERGRETVEIAKCESSYLHSC